MTNYSFLINLRYETSKPEILKPLSQKGFLISPKYAKGSILKEVEKLNKSGAAILVDNGNFSLIDDVTVNFDEQSDILREKVTKIEKKLKHRVRDGELDDSIMSEYTSLALEVQKVAESFSIHRTDQLESQIKTSANHLIGAENLTMAALMKLSIEPNYLKLNRDYYKNLNFEVTQKALEHLEKIPADLTNNYYPVASALSYDTAYDAGQVFARAGIKKVAMGFGGYLCDRRKTDYVDIAGKRIDFRDRLPNNYIRAGVVAKGFWDGYTDAMGKAPDAFHFLGLGVPIMIALTALFSWGTTLVTYDATSPIKDSFSGSLYLYQPSFLKVKNNRLATKLANGLFSKWDCPCPFCKDFIKKHPFNYEQGAKWYYENKREVTEDDLDSGSVIANAYPLFAKLDDNILGKEIRFARIGHNHWVLNKIMSELSDNAKDWNSFKDYMGSIVENYKKTAMSSELAQSIEFIYRCAVDNNLIKKEVS